MRYRFKSPVFGALQYTGLNTREVLDFCPELSRLSRDDNTPDVLVLVNRYKPDGADPSLIKGSKLREKISVQEHLNPNEWVVKNPDGGFQIMLDDRFKREYEPAVVRDYGQWKVQDDIIVKGPGPRIVNMDAAVEPPFGVCDAGIPVQPVHDMGVEV